MKELTNEMVKLISVKTGHYILTENIPRDLTQIELNSLHPKGCGTLEINGGQFNPIVRRNIIEVKV
jgi:hypothetical protein